MSSYRTELWHSYFPRTLVSRYLVLHSLGTSNSIHPTANRCPASWLHSDLGFWESFVAHFSKNERSGVNTTNDWLGSHQLQKHQQLQVSRRGLGFAVGRWLGGLLGVHGESMSIHSRSWFLESIRGLLLSKPTLFAFPMEKSLNELGNRKFTVIYLVFGYRWKFLWYHCMMLVLYVVVSGSLTDLADLQRLVRAEFYCEEKVKQRCGLFNLSFMEGMERCRILLFSRIMAWYLKWKNK